jgi:hypothetical protein
MPGTLFTVQAIRALRKYAAKVHITLLVLIKNNLNFLMVRI